MPCRDSEHPVRGVAPQPNAPAERRLSGNRCVINQWQRHRQHDGRHPVVGLGMQYAAGGGASHGEMNGGGANEAPRVETDLSSVEGMTALILQLVIHGLFVSLQEGSSPRTKSKDAHASCAQETRRQPNQTHSRIPS